MSLARGRSGGRTSRSEEPGRPPGSQESRTRPNASVLVKHCVSHSVNLGPYERQGAGWRLAPTPRYAQDGTSPCRRATRAFIPAPLPPQPALALTDELPGLLSAAERALGRPDGSVLTLPNPDLFVFMYVRTPDGTLPTYQRSKASSPVDGHPTWKTRQVPLQCSAAYRCLGGAGSD